MWKKVEKPEFKFHVKSGDTVKIISGDSKGKSGKILTVDRDKYRAIVEGANMIKKHVKPSAQDPQSGGIIQREAAIHISNLMVIDPATNEPTRVGRKLNEKGKLQRVSQKTGKFIADGKL